MCGSGANAQKLDKKTGKRRVEVNKIAQLLQSETFCAHQVQTHPCVLYID